MERPDLTGFCPHYPKPSSRRLTWWRLLWGKRRSWLDGLFHRSYTMKMGEVRLPGIHVVMVNEPSCVRTVLRDDGTQYPKHPLLAEALRPLLGDSIFTSNGETWRRQRRIMDPALDGVRVARVLSRMQGAVQAMMDRLSVGPAVNQEVEAEALMTHVTADVILRSVLSQPLGLGEARRLFEAFSRYQSLAPGLVLPALIGMRWWRSRRSRRGSEAAADEIRDLLRARVRPRYEAFLGSPSGQESDLLQALMQAFSDAGELAFEPLIDQVAMLFLAGHETSASALAWTLHLLAHDHKVQEACRLEISQVWTEETLSSDQLRSLPLLRACFKEALRLFPPVGFLARLSSVGGTLGGKALAAGGAVVVSPWLLHRHRKYWPNPDLFDPYRHLSQRATSGEYEDAPFLPFGAGPRVCIGASFAYQEAMLVLAHLLRHYRLSPKPGHTPEPVGRFTIRSANGIPILLTRIDAL